MLIHQLTSAECREVLARTTVGRLACARDNQPYIVPAFFDFDPDENCLYSFATRGRKIDWMRMNEKVCVELEEIRDPSHWTTILVFGKFQELDGSDTSRGGLRRAQALFERRERWWQPGAATVLATPDHAVPVFYRIRIDRITGRRAARPEAAEP